MFSNNEMFYFTQSPFPMKTRVRRIILKIRDKYEENTLLMNDFFSPKGMDLALRALLTIIKT